MISAVRFMHGVIGVELGEALRMASLYPAQAIGQSHRLGRFAKGTAADIVALNEELDVQGVWIGGQKVFSA
jgi:N-acetylglucosamine-6-phosphate deacetylase